MSLERWSAVSRQILLGVTAELLAVSAIAVLWAGWSAWAGLVLALSVVVGFRCLLSLATLGLSLWFGRMNAAPAPLGVRRACGMFARETAAFMRLFFVNHALEPLLNRHDPPAATDRTPVLLVHGFYANAGFWIAYKRFFRNRGIEGVYSVNLEPPLCDIDILAERLAERISQVCAHSGRPRVALVAQSMGGLVCRAYLARHGVDRVAKLITLGSPHQGTVLAGLLAGPNVRQMRPGNPWLTALNSTRVPMPISNHLSLHDNVVLPQDNARLPGADEVEYTAIGHMSMAFSREMMARVAAELLKDGPPALDKTGGSAQGL